MSPRFRNATQLYRCRSMASAVVRFLVAKGQFDELVFGPETALESWKSRRPLAGRSQERD